MAGTGLQRRWLSFNGVGLMGVVVQLGTLGLLAHVFGVHYLVATAIAVESAVLHNFVWHQRWTWRDRPTHSAKATAGRLARFHVLNGAVSLAGNLGVMTVLTGLFRIDPVAANIAAIMACAIVNFTASEVLVFKFTASEVLVFKTARVTAFVLIASLTPFLRPASLHAADMAAELTPAALAAWQQYERRVDERYERASSSGSFFAEDAFATQAGWRAQVIGGQVSMVRIPAAAPGQGEPSIPDGKVHHWAGAIFIPGAAVEPVIAHLRERAGRESESFEDVTASKLLWRDGDRLKIYMKLRRDSIITVSYNTEHEVAYRRLGGARASSRSVATKIAELADAGTAQEHETPAGRDRGFLWKLNAYWRFEQTANGVLIECESVSLSRGVPTLLRPFVTGTVERIARESLQRTLVSLRKDLMRTVAPRG